MFITFFSSKLLVLLKIATYYSLWLIKLKQVSRKFPQKINFPS